MHETAKPIEQESRIDFHQMHEYSEELMFVTQVMNDLTQMLEQGQISYNADIAQIFFELNQEILAHLEHLSVPLYRQTSSIGNTPIKDVNLAKLRLWVHGTSHFNESYSQEQRASMLKSLIGQILAQ